MAKKKERLGQYLQTAAVLRVGAIVIVSLSVIVINTRIHQLADVRLLAALVLLTAMIANVADLLRSVFLALERMEFDLVTRVAERGVSFLILLIFTSIGLNLTNAVLGLLLGSVIGLVLTAIFVLRLAPVALAKFDSGLVRPLLRAGLPMGGSILLVSFYARYDVIVLGIVKDASHVAQFSVAYSLILIQVSLSFSASSALLPSFSRLSRDDPSLQRTLFKESLRYSAIISVYMAGSILLLARPLILFVYGPEYEATIEVLQILSVSLIFMFPSHLMLNLLIARDNQDTVFYANLISAMLLLVLDPILIGRFGANGAAMSNIVVEGVVFSFYFLLVRGAIRDLSITILLRPSAAGVVSLMIYFLTPFSEVSRLTITGSSLILLLFAFRALKLTDVYRVRRLIPLWVQRAAISD
jgi:O-antigen/teichoic acid export membrane protein